MEFVRLVLVQITRPDRRIVPAIVYGALTQLVTGPLLTTVAGTLDKPVNDPKMIVKLLVVLVIMVPALVFRKRPKLDSRVFFGLFALTLLNVARGFLDIGPCLLALPAQRTALGNRARCSGASNSSLQPPTLSHSPDRVRHSGDERSRTCRMRCSPSFANNSTRASSLSSRT